MSMRNVFVSLAVLLGTTVSGWAAPVFAQDATPAPVVFAPGATIDIYGSGEVRVPASGAIVQMMFYQAYGAYSDVDMMASPVAEMFTEPVVSQDELDKIVSALVAAGLDESQVVAGLIPATSMMTMGGPGAAVVAFEVGADDVGRIDELATIAQSAGMLGGSAIGMVGVVYSVDGCDGVDQRAIAAALADAQSRAATVESAFGITLDGIVKIAVAGTYGPYFLSGPASGPCDPGITLEDALTTQINGSDQPLDGTVSFYAQVTVTYAVR